MTALESLKKHTIVVADTGDFQQLQKYKPQDSTTNPSLLYQASQIPAYKHLVDEAVKYGIEKGNGDSKKAVEAALDRVAVNFGKEILKIVPGRVSTEIDARLSFDTEATLRKAREIIEMYKSEGIEKERILIKIAATWEGLQAVRVLEKEGIHCNVTLMFSLCQAMEAAEAGATLISPFAGRITDFYKQKQGVSGFEPSKDPGVVSVKNIYNYYKTHGYKTVVMGASFRSKEQVMELCGCDLLTVAPNLLEELANTNVELKPTLLPELASAGTKEVLSESEFRWRLNEDEMAEIKLAEGIRKFAQDLVKLEDQIKKMISEHK